MLPNPQQAQPPQPGQSNISPPVSKIGPGLRTVILLLGFFLPLAGMITALVLWLTAGFRSATHEFLAHLRSGDCLGAYSLGSRELRGSIPLSDFCAYTNRAAPDVKVSTGEWISNFAGRGNAMCVEAQLRGGSVKNDTQYLILTKEGDDWRVVALSQQQPELCVPEPD